MCFAYIQVLFHILPKLNVATTSSTDNIEPIENFFQMSLSILPSTVLIAAVIRSFML